MFQQTNIDDYSPSSGTKIIKAEHFVKYSTAEDVLNNAIMSVEKMKDNAQVAYELQEEYGYQEGIEKANKDKVGMLINNSRLASEYLASLETDIIHLVYNSVKKIIGDIDYDEKFARIVRQGLFNIANDQKIVLTINTQDAFTVREKLQNFLAQRQNIVVSIDDELEKGKFTLTTDLGVADCSMDEHLEFFYSSLKKNFG